MGPLTQEEANTLIQLSKYLLNPQSFRFPMQSETRVYPLRYARQETDKTDMNISLYRGKKSAQKVSYRLLYRGNVVLVRVDLGDMSVHTNPDGSVISSNTPHIHIYDENDEDRVALRLPDEFQDSSDIYQTFRDFLSFSHVINIGEIAIYEQGVLLDEDGNELD